MKALKKNIVQVFITVGLLFLIYNISVVPTHSNTQTRFTKTSVPGDSQVIASQNSAALKNDN